MKAINNKLDIFTLFSSLTNIATLFVALALFSLPRVHSVWFQDLLKEKEKESEKKRKMKEKS